MFRRLRQLALVPAVLLSFGLLLRVTQFDRTGDRLLAQGNDPQVRQLLSEAGAKNGVTFTIEEALFEGGELERIQSFRHRTPPEGTGPVALLNDLSRSIPNFGWYRDPNNPKVTHILDDRLRQRKGYALDRTLDDIDFSGTVIELVDAIASRGIPISAGGPVGDGALIVMDGITVIRISAKGLKVRDALSDFVPLDGRGPILWTAKTYIDGPDKTTYLRFHGAPSKKPAPNQ